MRDAALLLALFATAEMVGYAVIRELTWASHRSGGPLGPFGSVTVKGGHVRHGTVGQMLAAAAGLVAITCDSNLIRATAMVVAGLGAGAVVDQMGIYIDADPDQERHSRSRLFVATSAALLLVAVGLWALTVPLGTWRTSRAQSWRPWRARFRCW